MYTGNPPPKYYRRTSGILTPTSMLDRQATLPISASSYQFFTTTGLQSFNFGTTLLRLAIILGGGGPGGQGQGNGAAGGGSSAIPLVLFNVQLPSSTVNLSVGSSGLGSYLHTWFAPPGQRGSDTTAGTLRGAGGLGGGGSGSGGGHTGGNGGAAGKAGQGIGDIAGYGQPWEIPSNLLIGPMVPGGGGTGGPSGSTGNSLGGVGYGAGGGGGDDTGGSGPGGGGGGILVNGWGPTANGGSGTTPGPGAPGFIYVEY